MKEKIAPYIHLFKTSERYYVYDVNTDKILTIPESVYNFLFDYDSNKVDKSVVDFVGNMKINGFLRSDRIEVSEHPVTPLLPYYLKNKLRQLILQVTQNCNLCCDYCNYSGLYKTRTHTANTMSAKTAEKAIGFFIIHAKDSEIVPESENFFSARWFDTTYIN